MISDFVVQKCTWALSGPHLTVGESHMCAYVNTGGHVRERWAVSRCARTHPWLQYGLLMPGSRQLPGAKPKGGPSAQSSPDIFHIKSLGCFSMVTH